MNLREYIKREGYSLEKFAKKLDITRHHLSMCTSGKSKMGVKTLRKVIKLTNGEVTKDDIAMPARCCKSCGRPYEVEEDEEEKELDLFEDLPRKKEEDKEILKDCVKKNVDDNAEMS